MKTKTRFRLDEKGQGLMEYLILVMLISVVSIAATRTLGASIKRKIQDARAQVNRLDDGIR